MVFYFDEKVKIYEKSFQWDQSLLYLEGLLRKNPNSSILNALVGYSWFYLVEGPIISRKYRSDLNFLPLEYWKKYVDLGLETASDDPWFDFIAGYTLSLDGSYLGATYEKTGNILMKKCSTTSDNLLLMKLVRNFIQNSSSKTYIPLQNGEEICSCLFSCSSLLEQYFREIYAR